MNHVAEEITIFDRYAVFFRILYTISVYKILHHRLFGQVFPTSMGNDHKKEGVKLPTGKQNFTTERIFIANHQCNFSHLVPLRKVFFLSLSTDRSSKKKAASIVGSFRIILRFYQDGVVPRFRSIASKFIVSFRGLFQVSWISFRALWYRFKLHGYRFEIHIIKLVAVSSLIVWFSKFIVSFWRL